MNYCRTVFFVIIFLFTNTCYSSAKRSIKVEMWKRFEIQIDNSSWHGNSFDVIFETTFTSPSGRIINHFGFYSGNNIWKVYFMPDEKGKWTYQTHSPDIELDGKLGKFICIDSELLPPLIPSGKQWQLKDYKGDFPVIWNPPFRSGKHWGFRGANHSDQKVKEALEYAHDIVGARLLGIGELIIASTDWAKDWPQSAVPYINGKEGEEFYLPFWDNLNAKMDAARELNMGAYIMLYSDDALKPDNFGITARSTKELRLFRYVVARLACYPHILWDTGIDIGEYRDNSWIKWFVEWFRINDPWQHPVGSRSGGGSGGIMPRDATYFSTGGALLPSRAELLEAYANTNVPIAQVDHWRPFISRGDWNITKIRVALWRCGLTGAQALFPDFNQGVIQFDQVEIAGQEIGYATHFFRHELRCDLLDLQPHDEMLVAGENAIMAANPNKEYVIYDEDGGELSVDLSAEKSTFFVDWYNPRNGEILPEEKIDGGKIQSFTSPTKGVDWVLHIFRK